MDRTCVSTGRSPETSGPSSPECTDPQRWRRRGGNPATNGVSSCTVTQARRASRDGSSSLFESGQRRRLRWGRVESAPLMAGAVALASTGYIAAIDERPGRATSARPGRPGSPQREPALPTETAREQSTRAQGRVILLERGLDRSPVAAAGTGCSPANGTLRSLDDWLVPACYQ